RDIGILKKRFDFGSEHEPLARQFAVEERLHAKAIPREKQPPRLLIPDGECEHASESIDEAHAPLLVSVHDDFGIRVGAESVTERGELRAYLGKVVDLAVEDDLHGAVFVGEGLIARRKVDDA